MRKYEATIVTEAIVTLSKKLIPQLSPNRCYSGFFGHYLILTRKDSHTKHDLLFVIYRYWAFLKKL